MSTLDIRLRVASPSLLGLPWRARLEHWDPTDVPLVDLPVGPSRHLVRFVEADGALWALKALPPAVAGREYELLRAMEDLELPAVRAAGVVEGAHDDEAILVTHYLEGSWQYRRLLMRVPASMTVHRGRLFDAVAVLMVDLHRNGVYWGDCSLANTLFMRDGQAIGAWLVDAETAELHPALSDGQRRMDLDVMVENVAGGLLDVAARREDPPDVHASILTEVDTLLERYDELWGLLHDEPIVGLEDHYEIESRVRRLNDAGFALDEVRLESAASASGPARAEQVRMKVAVAGRSYHREQLLRLTGLDVGEGQARILLNDLRAFHTRAQHESATAIPEPVAAQHWMSELYLPLSQRAHAALGARGSVSQAYCDLLEVRWLLSERAGHDVGDEAAMAALAERRTPDESAANLSFVELATAELPRIEPPDSTRG